ncbi:TIGR02611 family protein [Leucobacter chromiiresistens]|uniref:TIGR02611 family protein n=1 Tax=Leucobacter chromiiresistens TaxID=1079994 RepID=UPI000262B26E|nr:TIGR02611 family protein [Leucobacter chromiiresistens]
MPASHPHEAAPDGGRRRHWQRAARASARVRALIRRLPWLDALYRIALTAFGAIIVIAGLILVPLPGPGWLIVFFGLAILGTEFHWARRLLGWVRMAVARVTERWRAWRARRAAYST